MIEVRGEETNYEWSPLWLRYSDERERTKLGMKRNKAELLVAELTRPVTGYENLGKVPGQQLQIRGHGMDPEHVRIVPFRKGTWSRHE